MIIANNNFTFRLEVVTLKAWPQKKKAQAILGQDNRPYTGISNPLLFTIPHPKSKTSPFLLFSLSNTLSSCSRC